MVFYTKNNNGLPKERWQLSISIRSNLFFLKLLTSIKQNYLLTKLEITDFVWILKKVKYIMDSLKFKVITQINNLAIFDIIKQLSITLTCSTIKINV